MKKTEVLWKTQQDEVFAKIAILLGIDLADASTVGWFSHRMPAMGNILGQMIGQMMRAEKEQLERQHERLECKGNTEEDKRRLILIHGILAQMTDSQPCSQLGANIIVVSR